MKLSVLFFLWKHRTNKKGEAPIMCRITLQGERKQFSIGIHVKPNLWIASQQKLRGKTDYVKGINASMKMIKQEVFSKFHSAILSSSTELSAEAIYRAYKGIKSPVKSLMEVYEEFFNKRQKLVGIKYSSSTLNKISQSKSSVSNVIKETTGKTDVKLNKLKVSFIEDIIYVMNLDGYANATINKSIKILKQVVKYAIAREYLGKDPFIGYRLKHEHKPIKYLTKDELLRIVNWKPPTQKLINVKDCFVFSCYTGLDYSSSKSLRSHHISEYSNGQRWIEMIRKKTGRKIKVPLLTEAAEIVDKYLKNDSSTLPLYSNQKFNLYLKDIGEILTIKTKLVHHLARRTYATTVLLSQGVPMEVVKELLSHSSIQTTEASYAQINEKLIIQSLRDLM